MAKKPWRIIPRPLLETVLNNHAQQHRVRLPLLFHGLRGSGKTTLILDRLLGDWNQGPHVAGYVDFAECVGDHRHGSGESFPWSSWSNAPQKPRVSDCAAKLESCLESMLRRALRLGLVGSRDVFAAVDKWHSLSPAALGLISGDKSKKKLPSSKAALWDRAVLAISSSSSSSSSEGKGLSAEEAAYYREASAAVRVAKEVIGRQRRLRAGAIGEMNRRGGFSRTLANSCTDWPCILLELLSQAAELGHFQPKLIINNIEVLRLAILGDGDVSVPGAMYHDSLIWRLVVLGLNYEVLPVIFVTSDSYYSYRAFMDFGHEIFISRENNGWTREETRLHMVPDYFSELECKIINEMLGPNPRHYFELYALKLSSDSEKMGNAKGGSIHDLVDAYLAYLQVSVVNPAMDRVLKLVQKFASDARNGKIAKDKLRFGAPWRHPPKEDDPTLQLQWAKIQLMDFVQSLVKEGFALNYLGDYSLEIFDDPCCLAMIEVGLIYTRRDPSFISPVSRGIERCILRWFIQERIEMNFENMMKYRWQRFFRGRSYHHLLLQLGYK